MSPDIHNMWFNPFAWAFLGRAMYFLWVGMLVLVLSLAGAEEGTAGLSQAGAESQKSQPAGPSQATDDDVPEEPDFAFIASGPYTQKKNSIQFILPGQWLRQRTSIPGGTLHHAEYGTLLRTEWGFTDRLELDVIVPAEGARDRLGNLTTSSSFALSDAVGGVRYRLLREPSAPFTLTMGPQLILPSGSVAQGTGFDAAGYAWDLAAAKDWRGPVFLYTSLNYAFFPSVRDPAPGAQGNFGLNNVFWGTAVGLRPLEKPHGTSYHDVHLFLEYGLEREEGLEPGSGGTTKLSEIRTLFAPGLRYGFLTRTKKLFEVGVSFPVGLNHSTPRTGIIVQIQFEQVFGLQEE